MNAAGEETRVPIDKLGASEMSGVKGKGDQNDICFRRLRK
jgi:hypothetical protein